MEFNILPRKVEINNINFSLVNEISSYVEENLEIPVRELSYVEYIEFFKSGERKNFEKIYFQKRKMLSALGLYLQFKKNDKAITYFKELLWSISNEFSWALPAHFNYGIKGILGSADKLIDLFSSETAQTLSEMIVIHDEILEDILKEHIKFRVNERVIEPFINERWKWERETHNWNAVCSGCIGMIAIVLEDERKNAIINRVEENLKYYLDGFGEDGVSLEGIGYWIYGFGYYSYYKALKNEFIENEKIKAICSFPFKAQISEDKFITFSDVPPKVNIPTGLISYINKNVKDLNINLTAISNFDNDHCYRWGHLSRTLWWTVKLNENKDFKKGLYALKNSSWLIKKDEELFFAIKGGSNNEPHNHNDKGSFILALNGEEIFVDLGAGVYTKEYFSKKRYEYCNTRSYWHNVPLINNKEQNTGEEISNLIKVNKESYYYDLTSAYKEADIKLYKRKIDIHKNYIVLEEEISSDNFIELIEVFISYKKPKLIKEGLVAFKGKTEEILLKYNENNFTFNYEEKVIKNHFNEDKIVYRTFLVYKLNKKIVKEKIWLMKKGSSENE